MRNGKGLSKSFIKFKANVWKFCRWMLQKLVFLNEFENEGAISGHYANLKSQIFSFILPFARCDLLLLNQSLQQNLFVLRSRSASFLGMSGFLVLEKAIYTSCSFRANINEHFDVAILDVGLF